MLGLDEKTQTRHASLKTTRYKVDIALEEAHIIWNTSDIVYQPVMWNPARKARIYLNW